MIVCPCPRTELCDACLQRSKDWLGGGAMLRGERWAEHVARARPDLRGKPWPAFEDRCRDLALRHVADMSRDERVLEYLAGECHAQAERTWQANKWWWEPEGELLRPHPGVRRPMARAERAAPCRVEEQLRLPRRSRR